MSTLLGSPLSQWLKGWPWDLFWSWNNSLVWHKEKLENWFCIKACLLDDERCTEWTTQTWVEGIAGQPAASRPPAREQCQCHSNTSFILCIWAMERSRANCVCIVGFYWHSGLTGKTKTKLILLWALIKNLDHFFSFLSFFSGREIIHKIKKLWSLLSNPLSAMFQSSMFFFPFQTTTCSFIPWLVASLPSPADADLGILLFHILCHKEVVLWCAQACTCHGVAGN